MFRRLPRSTRTEPSFPTRRSSDLPIGFLRAVHRAGVDAEAPDIIFIGELPDRIGIVALARRDEITAVDALGHDRQTFDIVEQKQDRNSTRLNSSHECASRKPNSA